MLFVLSMAPLLTFVLLGARFWAVLLLTFGAKWGKLPGRRGSLNGCTASGVGTPFGGLRESSSRNRLH